MRPDWERYVGPDYAKPVQQVRRALLRAWIVPWVLLVPVIAATFSFRDTASSLVALIALCVWFCVAGVLVGQALYLLLTWGRIIRQDLSAMGIRTDRTAPLQNANLFAGWQKRNSVTTDQIRKAGQIRFRTDRAE
jgi:hypothetical protein